MRYYWKDKFHKGYINITNPFRGTWVVGTLGSGKTYSVIEPFIRQHSKKGFAMVGYDYKWLPFAQKLYYAYCLNKKTGALHGTKKDFQFNVINFVDVSHSRRVNSIQRKYIQNLTALYLQVRFPTCLQAGSVVRGLVTF